MRRVGCIAIMGRSITCLGNLLFWPNLLLACTELGKYFSNESFEYGKDLIAKAFSETSPIIRITTCNSQEDINIQQGIKFIAMRAMMSIRNPTSHGDKEQMCVDEAIELIRLASYLFKLVERRTINGSN